jgi:hypothetical protein
MCMLILSIVPTGKERSKSMQLSFPRMCAEGALTHSNAGYKRTTLYDRVEETLQQCPPIRPPVFPAPQGSGQGSSVKHA